MLDSSAKVLTIGDVIDYILPGQTKAQKPPAWPPDVFAIVASILRKSATYVKCGEARRAGNWPKDIEAKGTDWHKSCTDGRVPKEIVERWSVIIKNKNTSLEDLETFRDGEICNNLLELVAIADEASVGIGIDDSIDDQFLRKAGECLLYSGYRTLCEKVDTSKLCVLPKLHTPQSGMTLRSLTHHLAIWDSGEVVPNWFNCITRDEPRRRRKKSASKPKNIHSLNLLLIPWPELVRPADFRDAGPVTGANEGHRYFSYSIRGGARLHIKQALNLLQKAKTTVGRIDGIVFPEMALKDNEHLTLYDKISTTDPDTFLVGGVGRSPRTQRDMAHNSCVFMGRRRANGKLWPMKEEQAKHHRWRLDKRQIIQYGLGGQLDPECLWWERISFERRKLKFFALRPWLTLCVLLCEDLARQDPVSDLVRAVGPNLVIALLMDGPQLEKRWPARYATVLADDPGSSVLSLTSIGMTELCRPPGESAKRTIALWKDARTGVAVPIDLPVGTGAVVLTLTREEVEELTADGRSDHGTTGYLILSGCHTVPLDL